MSPIPPITILLVICASLRLGQGQLEDLNPLLFLDGAGDVVDTYTDLYTDPINIAAGQSATLQQMAAQMSTLEANIRSGALGGCESGVIGPFSSTQTTGTITFQGNFLTPPTISLALSDVTTLDSSQALSIQIRPSGLTTSSATVTISTSPTNNIASAFVSYMVCPSNSSPTVAPPANPAVVNPPIINPPVVAPPFFNPFFG